MNEMKRIVDLKWVPWTYASLFAVVVGVWAGDRFSTISNYGQNQFNGGAFVLGGALGFAVAAPLIFAFTMASRMVDNQVEIGARLAAMLALDGTSDV